MRIIEDNLKLLSKVNIVLILLDVAFIIFGIIGKYVEIINGSLLIVALAFGFIYSLKESKKSAANYYKMFMIIYTLMSLLDIVMFFFLSEYVDTFNTIGYIVICMRLVAFICIAALALVKNLGKNNSNTLAGTLFLINIVLFVICAFDKNQTGTYIMSFSNLLLSFTTYLLVNAKYFDKQSRGTD